ncbi:MAG: LysR family transcriptional regulator [Gammaproteobacteria bacterium]|nr:LysR family transcriptional regulator [Gammaproteobacteria bacterium]
MDIDQAKTFLAILAYGSFLDAAQHLHITQSTVSARIKNLEEELGAGLFVRNRSGASLTPAGRRFLPHAKRLVMTADQAKDEVGLPECFSASIRIGARMALWEGVLSEWVGWIRRWASDVVIRSEIGFEEDLMHRVIEGTLDVGFMYTPRHSPGLIVEHILDEKLVLVSTRPDDRSPKEDYVYIHWGAEFYTHHAKNYPSLERPAQTANIGWLGVQIILKNGGSCYLPSRITKPYIKDNKLFLVKDAPTFSQAAYAVYSRESENLVLEQTLTALRKQIAEA